MSGKFSDYSIVRKQGGTPLESEVNERNQRSGKWTHLERDHLRQNPYNRYYRQSLTFTLNKGFDFAKKVGVFSPNTHRVKRIFISNLQRHAESRRRKKYIAGENRQAI